ncbi:peptide ABC transporter substrate-binding protein, partial [bacterium]|nr:peptide ABC transporter substrate-binding protein [bacterium]
AEVRPELATSWTVSADATVYTFTLRSDIYWTDGHPVTAQDVRYGILRTLNPATGADYAYPLGVIK